MNRFVTLEGIDGSGKSTLIQGLAEALRANGQSVWVTREETESPFGEAVRQSIARRDHPLTTTFLFMADRAQHAVEIRTRLARGDWVLCDRYMHSTLAYQQVTLAPHVPEPLPFLRGLHAGLPVPDAVLYLRLDAPRAMARLDARSSKTVYEKEAFLTQVAAAYDALAATDRLHVLDASLAPAEVLAQAVNALDL